MIEHPDDKSLLVLEEGDIMQEGDRMTFNTGDRYGRGCSGWTAIPVRLIGRELCARAGHPPVVLRRNLGINTILD